MRIEKKCGNVLMNAVPLRVLLLVLTFAGLLPNNTATAQQANIPENRQATATAEQEMKKSVEGILATITQSRSTNTRGYKVVIRNDGSATAEIGGASLALPTEPSPSQQFPPERSIQRRCGVCLQRLGMSARSRREAARNRSPSERVLRSRMRARPVEICNASDSKHRTSIRRHCKHLKPWADSCRRP